MLQQSKMNLQQGAKKISMKTHSTIFWASMIFGAATGKDIVFLMIFWDRTSNNILDPPEQRQKSADPYL